MISVEAYEEILLLTDRAIADLKESKVLLIGVVGRAQLDEPFRDEISRASHARMLARLASGMLIAVDKHWEAGEI